MISVKTEIEKMGGLGSGRLSRYKAKRMVNHYRTIDIRKWRQQGVLIPGTAFTAEWTRDQKIVGSMSVLAREECLIFNYRYKDNNQWKDTNYSVQLEWSLCNLGGKRPWFLCPAHYCERRVAILYSGSFFACRHCYKLIYPSQREALEDRNARKADKIRERLGWEPGILNDEGYKPKGMHWKTFKRLCSVHENLVILSLKETAIRFGINIHDL